MPLPEPIATELEVIDAALAGDAVDPQFAELAELTLLLADGRPSLPAEVAERLDRRVGALASTPERHRMSRPRRSWMFRPACGAGLAGAVAVAVVVIVLVERGGTGPSRALAPDSAHGTAAAGVSANSKAVGTSGVAKRSNGQQNLDATPTLTSASSSSGSSSSAGVQGPAKAASAGASGVATPQSNGRRIVQSAQVTLSAPTARITTVSQELFSVVGAEAGIVKHSQVTSGGGGYADFSLSIPTQNLTTTLTRLTQLRYAHVSSSTESSTDVNSQYLDDARALKDAEALRTSLLAQLEAATTTAAIDSLKAQIQDAETAIAHDETKVNTLQGRISYTSVGVQINSGATLPVPLTPQVDHGFTISRAAHDALDVLTDVGGGALIALAVLLPVAIVAGLVIWLARGWRRRGRERALDAA
jgi:hypothetical protein